MSPTPLTISVPTSPAHRQTGFPSYLDHASTTTLSHPCALPPGTPASHVTQFLQLDDSHGPPAASHGSGGGLRRGLAAVLTGRSLTPAMMKPPVSPVVPGRSPRRSPRGGGEEERLLSPIEELRGDGDGEGQGSGRG